MSLLIIKEKNCFAKVLTEIVVFPLSILSFFSFDLRTMHLATQRNETEENSEITIQIWKRLARITTLTF